MNLKATDDRLPGGGRRIRKARVANSLHQLFLGENGGLPAVLNLRENRFCLRRQRCPIRDVAVWRRRLVATQDALTKRSFHRKIILMARITVEDCLEKIPNRFELVLGAAKRAKQLLKGARPLVETDNKEVVTALREIAAGKVSIERPEET